MIPPRPGDHARREIDAFDCHVASGEVAAHPPGAAAGVEHPGALATAAAKTSIIARSSAASARVSGSSAA